MSYIEKTSCQVIAGKVILRRQSLFSKIGTKIIGEKGQVQNVFSKSDWLINYNYIDQAIERFSARLICAQAIATTCDPDAGFDRIQT